MDSPSNRRDRSWIKRAPRVDATYDGLAVDSAGALYPVQIRDISSAGFKLHTEEPFRIGEYIGLRISKYGEFSAQIRWSLGNQAGGVFLNPIIWPPGE